MQDLPHASWYHILSGATQDRVCTHTTAQGEKVFPLNEARPSKIPVSTMYSGLAHLRKALAMSRGGGGPSVKHGGSWMGSSALPSPPSRLLHFPGTITLRLLLRQSEIADVFLREKNQLIMCRTKRLFSSEIILPSCKGTCLWANLEEG